MKPRKKAIPLAVAAAALLAATAFLLFKPSSPTSGINPRTYHRIKDGMTLSDVEAALGLRPGDYRSHDGRADDSGYGLREMQVSRLLTRRPDADPDIWTTPFWLADDYEIWVVVDEGGLVWQWCLEAKPGNAPPPLLERLKAWVGW